METFEALLAHVDPGFMCCACGDETGKKNLLVPLEHVANPPVDPQLLRRIPFVPGSEAARNFYARYNGAFLYAERGASVGPGGEPKGIVLFPVEQWPRRTAEVVAEWEGYGFDDSELPYGRHDFLAVAHVPGAWNYIHWVINGPAAGSIFWWAWTMPPFEDPPLAADFREFIELIATQPIYVLSDLGGYTRFETGGSQWIPSQYLPDCGWRRMGQ